jgi:16S rRNA (guanine527-N7)-methyltransferase
MPFSNSRQLSDEIIAAALAKFQVAVTPALCHSVREYIDLLLLWNQKVSLTAITSPLDILSRHFGESMFAAQVIPDLHGRLADVGSGPGFPGLALKILRHDLEVFVIESVMKKATFLAEVTRHLNLTGVKVVVSRFEDLVDDLAPLDFICARALGDRDTLLAWATHNLNIGGKVVLWLGADALDLAASQLGDDGTSDTSHPPEAAGWTWDPPIPIPESLHRYLLVGQKPTVKSSRRVK